MLILYLEFFRSLFPSGPPSVAPPTSSSAAPHESSSMSDNDDSALSNAELMPVPLTRKGTVCHVFLSYFIAAC